MQENLVYLSLDDFIIEDNPRTQTGLDDASIDSLANDIAARGLRYPLRVQARNVGVCGQKQYFVEDGQRRTNAIILLRDRGMDNGLSDKIPCIVSDGTTLEAKINALADNLQRSELSSFELAQAITILKNSGVMQKDIATRINKSSATVSRLISTLENACDQLQTAWQSGHIPDDIAFDIAQLPKKEQRAHVKKLTEIREATPEKIGAKTIREHIAENVKKTNTLGKPSILKIRNIYKLIKDAPEKNKYLNGFRDALKFAMGELEPTQFKADYTAYIETTFGSDECDECNGSGQYFIDGKPQKCICTEPQL